jgi:Cu/Ag efflux pump CusA
VRVDPDKLVSYGLSIGQVEQQLANNNINAGGSFVEIGMQQMNVRALGLFTSVHDVEQTVLKTQTGTALRVKDIAEVTQGPKIRLGHMTRANHMEDGRVIDEPDVIQGAVLLRKGAEEEATLKAIHAKVDELNNGILPPGVKVVPMLDRSDLLHYTLRTVLHNLTEGMILVSVILFLFLLNVRAALIVALTIPFSLLFASICLGDDLKTLEQKGEEVTAAMSSIPGMHDVKLLRGFGQPNLDLVVDRRQAARFGINVADVQDAVQTAIGGNAVSQVLQGEARYDVVVRYQTPYQNTAEAISRVRLVSPTGERVSLAQLSHVEVKDGAYDIYREGGTRYVAVTFNVRGRDLGTTVEEAIRKIKQQVKMHPAIVSAGRANTRAKSRRKPAWRWLCR